MLKQHNTIKPCKYGHSRLIKPSGQYYCPECAKHHYQNNKERYRNNEKEYVRKNINKIVERRKLYRKENKEKLSEYKKSYHKENREKILEKGKIYRKEKQHPDYPVWKNAKNRCNNPNADSFKDYGGRLPNPIKMCKKWEESFLEFLKDMGPRSEPRCKYTLERLDVNGNYEPKNCIWLLKSEQNWNTRRNISYKLNVPNSSPIYHPYGNLISLDEFSQKTGLHIIAAKYRYAKNWDAEYILNPGIENRRHKWRGQYYAAAELALISGVPYQTIRCRLIELGWSVEKSMEYKR